MDPVILIVGRMQWRAAREQFGMKRCSNASLFLHLAPPISMETESQVFWICWFF
jgi:hypothetical protein